MLPRTRRGFWSYSLFVIGIFCLVPCSLSQEQFECLVALDEVTLVTNDTLSFPVLPVRTLDCEPNYDPGFLENWFALATSFADLVRSGGLPYDVIASYISESNLPCDVIDPPPPECNDADSGTFDFLEVLEDLLEWMMPILAVVCVGGTLAVLFLLAGCVFCCCRCYGRCGANTRSEKKVLSFEEEKLDRNVCKPIALTCILLLFTLALLAGVLLAFFSNEKSYTVVSDVLNETVVTGAEYVEECVEDADFLICQFDDVASLAVQEANYMKENLTTVTEDIVDLTTEVYGILTQVSNGLTQEKISNITDILFEIDVQSTELQDRTDSLAERLENIRIDVDSLLSACNSSEIDCSLIPDPNQLNVAADFDELPNVTQQQRDLQNTSVGSINITMEIEMGSEQIAEDTERVLTAVNLGIGDVLLEITTAREEFYETWDRIRSDIIKVLQNDQELEDCPPLDELTLGPDTNLGVIQQCGIAQAIEPIQELNFIRYWCGIAACGVAMVSVILVLTGVLLGMIGLRRKSVYERTMTSHCGGVILLIAVGGMFLFGFLLLILASLSFFMGVGVLKSCQAMEGPSYEFFTETAKRYLLTLTSSAVVDNNELWGGSLLGTLVFRDSSEVFAISEALRNCEANQTLYTALNLSNIVDVEVEFVISQEFINAVNGEVDNVTAAFIHSYQPNHFLSTIAQEELMSFVDANIDGINTTAFHEAINASLLAFDISSTIDNLVMLNETLTMNEGRRLGRRLQDIISELIDVQDNYILPIQRNLDQLEADVDELTAFIDNVVIDTSIAVDKIAFLSQMLTEEPLLHLLNPVTAGSARRIISYTRQFFRHTISEITEEVCDCRPLWVAYTDFYNTLCRDKLDGMNGFWWSIGYCALFFVPVIVLSVLVSTVYMRKKRLILFDCYTDFPRTSLNLSTFAKDEDKLITSILKHR